MREFLFDMLDEKITATMTAKNAAEAVAYHLICTNPDYSNNEDMLGVFVVIAANSRAVARGCAPDSCDLKTMMMAAAGSVATSFTRQNITPEATRMLDNLTDHMAGMRGAEETGDTQAVLRKAVMVTAGAAVMIETLVAQNPALEERLKAADIKANRAAAPVSRPG